MSLKRSATNLSIYLLYYFQKYFPGITPNYVTFIQSFPVYSKIHDQNRLEKSHIILMEDSKKQSPVCLCV